VWRLDERTLFVGDLVNSGMHAYLTDGYASEGLTHLRQLEQRILDRSALYIGQDEPGGTELIAAQSRYVSTFVAAVEKSLTLPESERAGGVRVAARHRLGPLTSPRGRTSVTAA
jgi:hypothetical protein